MGQRGSPVARQPARNIQRRSDAQGLNPCFAESYSESEDGKEVTFVLPEGAKFSNGDTLDAEAVKASFERMKEISQYSGDIDAVTDIQVVDERTVKFASFRACSLYVGKPWKQLSAASSVLR